MKKMYQFLLATVTLVASVAMISCNKTDDDFSNNVPQADPSEVLFTWEGGEKDITVRPTQGTRMTKDWFFVEADLPEEAVFTKERVVVDTTKTPGVKVISNSWVTLTVTDLGRQIKVKALRNRTPSQRAIRFTGKCNDNRFSFVVRQKADYIGSLLLQRFEARYHLGRFFYQMVCQAAE